MKGKSMDNILGSWVTAGTKTPFYLRKAFTVRGKVKNAQALVTGLGQFNFYLNGEKVGDHFLDPGWTDYRKVVQTLRHLTSDLDEIFNKRSGSDRDNS